MVEDIPCIFHCFIETTSQSRCTSASPNLKLSLFSESMHSIFRNIKPIKINNSNSYSGLIKRKPFFIFIVFLILVSYNYLFLIFEKNLGDNVFSFGSLHLMRNRVSASGIALKSALFVLFLISSLFVITLTLLVLS